MKQMNIEKRIKHYMEQSYSTEQAKQKAHIKHSSYDTIDDDA